MFFFLCLSVNLNRADFVKDLEEANENLWGGACSSFKLRVKDKGMTKGARGFRVTLGRRGEWWHMAWSESCKIPHSAETAFSWLGGSRCVWARGREWTHTFQNYRGWVDTGLAVQLKIALASSGFFCFFLPSGLSMSFCPTPPFLHSFSFFSDFAPI